MKSYFYLLAILVLLYACNTEKAEVLPVDSIYVYEFNYVMPEEFYSDIEYENGYDYSSQFVLFGFSELSKDYSLKAASLRKGNELRKDNEYCVSYSYLPDSIREIINATILNYPADTATFIRREPYIYDGNHYLFVIETGNQERYITFIPHNLPKDLSFLFDNIYEQRIKDIHRLKQCDTIQTFGNYVNRIECLVDSIADVMLKRVPIPEFIPPVVAKD